MRPAAVLLVVVGLVRGMIRSTRLHLVCALLLGALLCAGCARRIPSARPAPEGTEAASETDAASRLAEAQEIVAAAAREAQEAGDKPCWTTEHSVGDARKAAALAPGLPAAHLLLGKALMDEAWFGEAAQSFRTCVSLDPDNDAARQYLREVKGLTELADSLPLALAPGQRLFRLVEMQQAGEPAVFALVGFWEEFRDEDRETWDAVWDIYNPEARWFVRDQRGYREADRTRAVFWEDRDSVRRYRVWVADFLEMGSPQVIVEGLQYGADHFRQSLDIFRPEGDSLSHIVRVSGHAPGGGTVLEWADIDGDGRDEIEVWHIVEFYAASCSMWRDVYRYDGRRYALATGSFPEVVRENIAELESRREFLLAEEGWEDTSILEHLVRAYAYLGETEKSAACERTLEEWRAR